MLTGYSASLKFNIDLPQNVGILNDNVSRVC